MVAGASRDRPLRRRPASRTLTPGETAGQRTGARRSSHFPNHFCGEEPNYVSAPDSPNPDAWLYKGINLTKGSDNNPLVPAFRKIEDAVYKKQESKTRQIKALVHGPEGAADLEATFALTEKTRAPLESAVLAATQ